MTGWWERRLSQEPSSPPPVRRQPELPVPKPRTPPEDLCPNCGSENYLSATSLTQKRCYDCGHPVVQSGTGVSSGRTDGTVKGAKQIRSGGYSPGTIVGRVQ